MGGSSGGGAEVVNQGGLIDSPLNQFLIPQAGNMLNYAGQYSDKGPGHNLSPNMLMGQVYVPGPNQTVQGNPWNTQQQSAAYFGPAAVPNAQALYNTFLHPGGGGYNYGAGSYLGNGASGLGNSRIASNQQGVQGNAPANNGAITAPMIGQALGKLQSIPNNLNPSQLAQQQAQVSPQQQQQALIKTDNGGIA